MEDGTIHWSSEHTFQVKREGSEFLWTMDRIQLLSEQETGLIGGIKNWDLVMDRESGITEQFAVENGQKFNTPVEIEGEHNMPLYLPITENGELIFVNKYLVGASIAWNIPLIILN